MAATGERQQTDDVTRLERENAELRDRAERLEAELSAQAAAANRAIAAAQERAYWLDRWHLDLNALMRRPGAAQLRALVRAFRAVVRFARSLSSRG